MFKRTEDRTKKGKELRSVFVDTLLKMMETDENIVALDGDLGGASKFTDIAKTYSDRFIQCGISEANMVGTPEFLQKEFKLTAQDLEQFKHCYSKIGSKNPIFFIRNKHYNVMIIMR